MQPPHHAATGVSWRTIETPGVKQTPAPCTPCLELVRAVVLRDGGDAPGLSVRAAELPGARVWFEYPWGRVRGGEMGSTHRATRRDLAAEGRAYMQLEQLGLTEARAHEAIALGMDCDVDFIVGDGVDDASGLRFSATGRARLVAEGWQVVEDADYPLIAPSSDAWRGRSEPSEASPGWFELELGVEINGRFVDLLPMLLELLQDTSGEIRLLHNRDYTAVPLEGKRAVVLPTARVDGLLGVLRELYALDPSTLSRVAVPALVPHYFERFEAALERPLAWGDVGETGETGETARAATSLDAPELRSPTPRNLRATLRPYQAQGLAWMRGLAARGVGGILADDMGLGKTLQTIAFLCDLCARGELRSPALVVAPTSLMGNWRRELRTFAPHLEVVTLHGARRAAARRKMGRAHVVLTTYGTLARELTHIEALSWRLLVLDEAHAIKNAKSRAHAHALAVPAKQRLCLTGTPIENDLEELRALMEFAVPGLLGSAMAFRRTFRGPIEVEGDAARMERLRERIGPYLLRRLKTDVVPELPKKTEMRAEVQVLGGQRELYEHIRVSAHDKVRTLIQQKGLSASTVDILAALTRLRQVCCDPRLLGERGAKIPESAKLDRLMEMLARMLPQGRRVLIFSQFTSMLGLISARMRDSKIPHLALTGATRDRQELVDAFERGAADVFLLSLKAAGTGLNLTSADTVIHYDPWWNPSAQSQATDRAYRIGQTRPVFVYNLVVAGSVEEKILELQRRKKVLAEGVLSAEAPAALGLDADDVDDLFSSLEPDGR